MRYMRGFLMDNPTKSSSNCISSDESRQHADHIHFINYQLAQPSSRISAIRQNFKNLVGNFFNINTKSLYAKFQLSSFKTEEGV